MKALTSDYWRTELDNGNQWLHAHPIKVCVFTAFFIFCGAIWEEWDWPIAAAASASGCLVLVLTILVDLKRMVSLVVAIALFINPPLRADEPQPLPLAACVVGIAIIIGGFIGCKCIKRGGKVAKGRTNGWPEELNFQVAGQTIQYGAVFSEAEYCVAERLLPKTPVTFTLTIHVESSSNVTTTIRADVGEQFVQAVPVFREELETQGLELASTPGRTESYSRNGHPVFAEQVPITYDWLTGTATVGAGGVLVTVEASDDLNVWIPLMRINVEAGATVEAQDVTESGMQFYRVRAF